MENQGYILFSIYIALFCLSILLHIKITKIYLMFIFNEIRENPNIKYDKKIEYPRCLIHLFGSFFVILSLYTYHDNIITTPLNNIQKLPFWGIISNNAFVVITIVASIALFVLGSLIIIFCWSRRFESAYQIDKEKDSIIEKIIDFSLSLKEGLDIVKIADALVLEKKILLESKETVITFLCKKQNISKIEWIATSRSGKINYMSLFNFLHLIHTDGIYNFRGKERKALITFIIQHFSKFKENIEYSTLDSSYTNWTPPK